ncbi:MAG: zinc ribbon domain-containing protein [Bacilli bacterium]|nr:zinc ribbon domain-containing protein [Bacilli bacterium]
MYCGECGTKLRKGSAFCGECGTAVESDDQLESVVEVTDQVQASPKRSISKKNKRIFAVVFVVVLGLFLGYRYFSEKFGPLGVAKEYVEALMHRDADILYNYLTMEGDRTFTSKEKFKEIIKASKDTQEITNYRFEGVTYGEGKLSAKVDVSYTMKGAPSEISEAVHLIKKKEKKYFIFDTWELNEDFDSLLVKNYHVRVPKNSKVSIDGITLTEKYLDKKASTKKLDVYTIPQIFKSEVTIVTDIAGFEVEKQVVPSSYSYTATLDLDSLSKKSTKDLEEQLKLDVTSLYQHLIEKEKWEDIKELYDFDNADLDGLEEVYESLYKEIVDNERKTLKSLEVTSISIHSVSSEDNGEIAIGVRFDYNYTIDYKKLGDQVEEKSGKNTTNAILYYVSSNEKLQLVDAAYLVSYFSIY